VLACKQGPGRLGLYAYCRAVPAEPLHDRSAESSEEPLAEHYDRRASERSDSLCKIVVAATGSLVVTASSSLAAPVDLAECCSVVCPQ
jgi:hypothetical protein